MSTGVQQDVQAGREALDRHDWDEAYTRLSAADGAGALDADGLQDLGWAAWWSGHSDACVDARGRAYQAFVEEGRPDEAGRVGLDLAMVLSNRGEGAVANGWLSRVKRLLADVPETPAHSYLESVLGVYAQYGGASPEEALAHAERAVRIAERVGKPDHIAAALNRYGSILVWAGRVEEGMAALDESMVAAVEGNLEPFITGLIYCNTISACSELADYRRAGEWTDAARRWCERQSISGFPGICRVHRAAIMKLRGAWTEAEAEARRAAEELGGHGLQQMAGSGLYEVGEIRMRLGDLAGAEEAFAQAHEFGHDPQPGLALLRLAQGKTEAAAAAIAVALSETDDRLRRARLLPVKAEAAVRMGDLEAAREAATELAAIAEAYGSPALEAIAVSCRAGVSMLEGDADAAIREARRGWKLWVELEAPYEAARTRTLLGEIHLRAGDRDSAALEYRAARTAFDTLGAVPDARAAAAALESIEAGDDAPVQRREVRTFMFTDIVQSTNLLELLGDEPYGDLLRWHDAALRQLFLEHGGEEIDHAGDGFFVAFPDAARAVACAVAIQRKLSEHRREHGFAPQVRIGLHAAEATREASNYRGRGVHEAARIGALGTGGEIVASASTVEAAGGPPTIGDPRPADLKGLAEPIEVVSIEWRT